MVANGSLNDRLTFSSSQVSGGGIVFNLRVRLLAFVRGFISCDFHSVITPEDSPISTRHYLIPPDTELLRYALRDG
jgi:hypothetical protein